MIKVVTLLNEVKFIQTGAPHKVHVSKHTFQLSGIVTQETGAVIVKIQGSNDGTTWIDIGEIAMILYTSASADGLMVDEPWQYVRGKIIQISGSNATVTLTMGEEN